MNSLPHTSTPDGAGPVVLPAAAGEAPASKPNHPNFRVDLTGMTFGRLTVLYRAPRKNESRQVRWVCECTCGSIADVRGDHLSRGETLSCGCLQDETRKASAAAKFTKHGSRPKGKHIRLYSTWVGMKSRCSNPRNSSYRWYGGKGISVCPEWQTFKSFRDWSMANGYRDDLTIDRADPSKDYNPSNCRFIPGIENSRRVVHHKLSKLSMQRIKFLLCLDLMSQNSIQKIFHVSQKTIHRIKANAMEADLGY